MVACINCEGWGCAQCANERAAARGGEQGPSALELKLAMITAERDEARALFASWQQQALYLQSQHEPCETHHGARRACGQCLSSTQQHLADARLEVERLTRECVATGDVGDFAVAVAKRWKEAAERERSAVERLREALRRTLECVEGETCGECAEELEVCACDGSSWWRQARAALAEVTS